MANKELQRLRTADGCITRIVLPSGVVIVSLEADSHRESMGISPKRCSEQVLQNSQFENLLVTVSIRS